MTIAIVRNRYLISFYGTYSRTSPFPCRYSTISALLSFSPVFASSLLYEPREYSPSRNHNETNSYIFDFSLFFFFFTHTLEPVESFQLFFCIRLSDLDVKIYYILRSQFFRAIAPEIHWYPTTPVKIFEKTYNRIFRRIAPFRKVTRRDSEESRRARIAGISRGLTKITTVVAVSLHLVPDSLRSAIDNSVCFSTR